jgi:hypothetical protein
MTDLRAKLANHRQWRVHLTTEERIELARLEREIKKAERTTSVHRMLRQKIQNRASVRAGYQVGKTKAAGNGEAIKWLHEKTSYSGNECLTWPFCRGQYGYGILVVYYRRYAAHRLMCKLAHGEPPTPLHQAAHSCGKGHEGCVNPRHLSWKTSAENGDDRRKHGTAKHTWKGRAKLTPEDAIKIYSLRGIETIAEIAPKFGVSKFTISNIFSGKVWRKYTRKD